MPNEKPYDWLKYKNGAKNSVFKFQYQKAAENEYKLLFKLPNNESINLSKIVIGFEQKESPL